MQKKSLIESSRKESVTEPNDIMKDIESQSIFSESDFNPAPQAALNLRDSFVQLEQKQANKSEMKASFVNNETTRALRSELEEARVNLRSMAE